MDGHRTRILNDTLNVTSTIYHNGGAVTTSNPLPCVLGADGVTIIGDVIVPGEVTVNNSPSNLLYVSVQSRVPVLLAAGSNAVGSVGLLHLSEPVTGLNPLPTRPVYPDAYVDAFGRQRVSDCFTLGDYKHVYSIDLNFIDRASNGAGFAFTKNRACCTLTTTTAADSAIVHQTRCYHHYQPGKSHLVMSSLNFGGFQSNVVKRTGYYDDSDGIYLELNGGNELSFNIRAPSGGGPVNTRAVQSDWNRDRLDGTGPSGATLDTTKTQLFFTDFQWLGVGRVRCGFSLDGVSVVAHEFYHSNRRDTVYIANPSLPIRSELSNVGAVASPGGAMDQICSTVISEGGYLETGVDYSALSGIRTISAGVGNALPVICIALTNTFKTYANRALVRLVSSSVLSTDNSVSYHILRVPSVTNVVGGAWVSADADSAVQYNVTATSLSAVGTAISVGFVAGGTAGPPNQGNSATSPGSSAKRNYISQNIDSTDSEVYAVYVKTLAVSITHVVGAMQWREMY